MTDIIDPEGQASKNMELVKSVARLINISDDIHAQLFIKAVKRFELTENELVDGFWRAYADHMIPSSGIEFRHIFKHVTQIREEKDREFFTGDMYSKDRF